MLVFYSATGAELIQKKSIQYSEARVKAEIEFGLKTTLAALI